MPPVPDPYRLLGIDRSADARSVKRTYRRLAKRYHPDTTEGADVRHFLALGFVTTIILGMALLLSSGLILKMAAFPTNLPPILISLTRLT